MIKSLFFTYIIFLMVHTLTSIIFIAYGNNKNISALDNIFSTKTDLPMIWSWKANRFHFYCLKYPFFCIFNKHKSISIKMHLFMAFNSFVLWIFVIGMIWATFLE